jgi:hypothetical protein
MLDDCKKARQAGLSCAPFENPSHPASYRVRVCYFSCTMRCTLFLPSAQNEALARDRKACASFSVVGCLHANYSTSSLDP